MSIVIVETLKTAIEKKNCVRIVAGGIWREISPFSLGYKAEKLKILGYQYRGQSASGISADGGWRCFFVDDITWIKEIGDPWHSGHAAIAKIEASFDHVICGAGADVRSYGPAKH